MKVLKSIEKAKLRYSDKLEEVKWFFNTNKIRNTGKVMRDFESRETITELEEELRSFESAKEGTYDKRTEHLNMNGSAVFINRLVKEDSPYLLQHAHNPVNWFPWGEEAFEVSRSLNRPIFLSIGYSTCHWCHVMEVESFDNVEVAKVLNDHFVSIKMDREQYPDIDEIYMTGLQLISGHGGWPMSNFLLADGKPFFAATYFPPPNFKQLLLNIVNAWNEKYPELQNSANKISDSINKMLGGEREVVKLNENLAKNVCEALSQREDRSLGGLAGAPKFPQEPLILFLLERAAVTREVSTLGFVTRALEGMGRGGIYDQVGGGFHRYSVDEEWLVPHFEKMLYNQSQLALIYLQAYRFTGDAYFKRVCDQTLTYVLRDMQLPEGGFYSATDADSEGAEGIFFLWTKDEIESVLTEIEAKLIIDVYGITEVGNFEGSNILNLSRSFSDVEKRHGEDFAKRLDKVLLKLYKVREQREHPLRDEKLIVAWAAAFVNTLALAGSYFNNKEWVESAEKAIRLIVKKCVAKDFRLSRIYLNGNVSIEGQLEDYVNLIEAMLSLFDITSNLIFLNQANSLMEKCIDEFWDEESDRFYLSPANQLGPQLTRSSSAADGAVLSPTATAINCLYKLQQRRALITETTSVDYKKLADRGLSSLGGDINESPMSHTSVLRRAEQIKWGSIDLCQYSDDGLVKVSVIKQSKEDSTTKSLCFRVDLAPDWHVVATETTAQDYSRFFVAAHPKEEHWEVLDIYYPDPSGTLAPEGGTKISIYKNEFTANVNLVRSQIPEDDFSFSALLVVNLQLCNDKHCLLPTTINFRV